MKINSINLNTYRAMNNIKPVTNNLPRPAQQTQVAERIKGANFIDQLSEQEINFLNNNFPRAETAAGAANRQAFTETKHKIDILA